MKRIKEIFNECYINKVTKKGIEIVDNHSLLPTVTEDTICYCIEDYIDIAEFIKQKPKISR